MRLQLLKRDGHEKIKKIRVVVSLAFVSMFLFAFLSPLRPNEYFTHTIIALQFYPSLLEFSTSFLMGGGSGFMLIMLLTFFYGRVYCSTLCPLGGLQDGIIRCRVQGAGGKRKHVAFKYTKSMDWLLYPITIIVLVLLAFGIPSALNLFEPYSNFGRMTVNLLKPALVYVNNTLEYILATFDITVFKPSSVQYISPGVLGFCAGFLGLIVILSLYKGRLYCNTLCPVGGVLSLISRFSRNRLVISADKCTSCSLCEGACKAGCIDYKAGKIDFERCISCFNCVDSCKFGAITYQKFPLFKKPGYSAAQRGAIGGMLKAGAALALMTAGAEKLYAQINSVLLPVKRQNTILPPGAISFEHFSKRCTGCNLCVTSCPTKVIAPSFAEAGAKSLMQVRMDYDTAYCNYNCNICSRVCPCGAMVALSVTQKKLTQIGTAKFVKNECVVVKKGTVCATCNEHCPTKAVKMVPYKKDLNIPEVNEKTCIGCGACEHVCPARPKAIYVAPKDVQTKADKPVELKRKIIEFKEFPF